MAGWVLLEQILHNDRQEASMAYIGREEYEPLWLPESLPDDILPGSLIRVLGMEMEREAEASAPEPSCGFIIRDWFGPFLLSPPSRYLRGRC